MGEVVGTIVVIAIVWGIAQMLWGWSNEAYEYAEDTARLARTGGDPTGGHAKSVANYEKTAGDWRRFAAGVVVVGIIVIFWIWF